MGMEAKLHFKFNKRKNEGDYPLPFWFYIHCSKSLLLFLLLEIVMGNGYIESKNIRPQIYKLSSQISLLYGNIFNNMQALQ